MDNGAEPKSWLPDGAAPAVTADEGQSEDAPAAAEETSADLDPVTYGENGSYVYGDEARADAPGAYEFSASSSHRASADAWQDSPAGASQDTSADAPDEAASEVFTAWSVRPSLGLSAYDTPSYPASGGDSAEEPGSGRYGASAVGAYGGLGGYAGGTTGSSGYNSDMSPTADETGPASSSAPEAAGYQATTPQRRYSARGAYGAAGAAPAGSGYSSGAREAGPADASAVARGKAGSRRANLLIARLEPWSVMKFSFMMSLVAWVVLVVAVALLYFTLSGLGVFSSLGKTLSSVTSSQGSTGSSISAWTAPSRVLGYTMLLGAFDVVVITALSTIGSMIYNLVSRLGGGIEITLKEAD